MWFMHTLILASLLRCQSALGRSHTGQTDTHQPLRVLIWTTDLGMNNFLLKTTSHSYLKSGLGNAQVPLPNTQREAMAGDSGDPTFNIEGTFVSLFPVDRT